MKRPTMLVQAILRQLSLDLDLSVERDLQRVADRFEHEGLSFFTITLPQLSDALERGLEAGTFTCPSAFARHGRLPRFLGGFFKRVFDKDGRLLNEPCPFTIAGIRQVCRFFKKLKLPCSPRRNAKAIRHFIEVEGELRAMTSQVERKDIILDKISGILWSQDFPELSYLDLVCHHGPGVTADRYASNQRYRITKWNHRSEYSFPSDLHCYPNYGIAAEVGGTGEGTGCRTGVEYLELKDENPVRVVFVPKTQTAPRVIAIEPSHVQYMQQSVKDFLYTTLETHALTRHSIRFTRQDVNQRLAYQASKDRRLATLDLKDASDRVHLHLVQRIFKTSGLLEYLEDARSLHAVLPNGTNIVLFKYASMGSALCFPVEAMVFYTLIQSAMHILDGGRPSSRSISRYSKLIDIYGDDIIVPVEYADFVVKYLESYALKVNVNKSFKDSSFRESCGADFFAGVPVNPVYARMLPHDSSQRWDASTIMSWNATADLFYQRGQWHVAQVIRDLLRRVVKRTIPRARKPGSGLSHLSFLFDTHCHYDKELQGWKQKRIVFDPVKRKDQIDGDEIACLNKWGISSYRRDSFGNEGVGNSFKRRPTWLYVGGSRPQVRKSRTDMGRECIPVDASVSNERVCSVQDRLYEHGNSSRVLPDLAELCDTSCCGSREGEPSSSTGSFGSFVEEWWPDPLSHLTDDKTGLDFLTSTKRGSFKSKCRWISLVS
ncbi:TPA_asm: RNA-directed RNA polymerase [ssRNA phage Gerhypos.4_64]|uniref:RNA-directed RNA polymerase n=2 Tax=Leviviricetes TaxID=2842243 RepID=A0A8S5KYE9_9VIRU|nr:RNA-directed RNA polymerase [ssRNA phage Gerhypos.4_64]QDH86960.1 MAG: RNA-dependent RNA polymerase [Leviviridae sp.]DAD50077.1 TPA_asm: RNA-directed RNA polymerase [ssRNA phage Gerhypos.4_64]